MLTPDFFRNLLGPHLVEKTLFSPDNVISVELHLQSGTTYTLASFVDIADDALFVDVYPEKGNPLRTHAAEQALGAPELQLDRVAVAYNTISHVVMTARRASKNRRFNA